MIYLDYAATGIAYPEVLALDMEAEKKFFANASSLHAAGYAAHKALEEARKSMLRYFGLGSSHRLIFTSGATESNNALIKGVCLRYGNRGKKIITTPTEHPSVTNAFESMKQLGFEVIYVPVNEVGQVTSEALESLMDDQVLLVSIIGVNNETGVIQDLKALSEVVHRFPKAIFHSDLTQGVGKTDLPYSCLDAFSFSAHKFGGRKGIGGLVLSSKLNPVSLLSGGQQEEGYRGGTVNVPGAVTMAKALEICKAHEQIDRPHIRELCAYLTENLAKHEDLIEINSPEGHLPYVTNFSFTKHKASVIVEALSRKEIYVSSVSACFSKVEPVSHVLLAMGKSKEQAGNSMRVSFGPATTKEEIDIFLNTLFELLKEIRTR